MGETILLNNSVYPPPRLTFDNIVKIYFIIIFQWEGS